MRRRTVLAGLVCAGLLGVGLLVARRAMLPDGVPPEVAEPAIIASAASHGWHVAERAPGRYPPELHGWSAPGTSLVLVGPTEVAVRGFYCSREWCEDPIQAREAIELWLMPVDKADEDGFSLQAYRVPTSIYASRKLHIYGLVSRWWPGSTFDENFTDASSEASRLGPYTQDLPVSWPTWSTDVPGAIEGANR